MNEEVQPARRYVKARLLELQQHAEEMQRLIRWALQEIAKLDAIRIRRWRCTHCGHVTAFSKPSTIEACGKCPQCKGEKFVPDGEKTPLSD